MNTSFEKIFVHLKNRFKSVPYSIISLGPNCYPRTILSRNKLIKTKMEGQISYPFDLAWFHSAKYVTEFLSNNFNNFLSDLRYSQYSGSWDNGVKINFSHEAYIGPNEKNKLIKIYKKRINNFNKALKNNKPIVFIQIFKDEKVGQDCINTYNVLKNLCSHKNFIYIVIDCAGCLKDIILSRNICLLDIKLPNNVKNSDVFSPDFYCSEKGQIFEKTISNFIQNTIEQKLGYAPIKFL